MVTFTLEKVIGHRGAAGYAPENTLPAFQRAFNMGCRCVEFDVMISADGEAFVFHDEQLQRTTNGHGDIEFVKADYLRSLDAGSWFSSEYTGVRIPTLRDVLIWLEKTNMQANIEIKAHPTLDVTVAVLKHLQHYWPKNKMLPLVSSFDFKALKLCYSSRPDLPLGLLLRVWPKNWLALAKSINCFSINISGRIATPKRIAAMKAEGYKVCVYTVNRRASALKLFDWGVDAVFSDYPDLLSSH
ncbi:MAG: glycerophosphoryl diester phosphodiesterase [Legionellaceae bacterium]|nr:glycerophosphoryl diester phosphodiesterase [Legionellaceae bacterium]